MDAPLVLGWSPTHPDTLASVSVRAGLSLYINRHLVVKDVASSLALNSLDHSPNHVGLLACGSDLGQLTLFNDGMKMHTMSAQKPRSIRFLCWDTAADGKIAVGFQSVRGEPGLSILDLAELQSHDDEERVELHNLYFGEGTTNGSFLRPHVLALGMQSRHLRVVDFRTPDHSGNLQTVAHPWGSVRGVRSSQGELIATFGATAGSAAAGLASGNPPLDPESSSSCVKIWDVRRFDKSIATLTAAKGQLTRNITQLEWDPIKPKVLHFIHGNEQFIRSIRLDEESDDGINVVVARGTSDIPTSMAFKQGSPIFAMSLANHDIEYASIRRLYFTRFGRQETGLVKVTNAHDGQLLREMELKSDANIDLVRSGYGANPTLNAQLTSNGLKRVWEWIGRGGNKSWVDPCSVVSRKTLVIFPSFTSPARQQTLKLCGWGGSQPAKDYDWQTTVAISILDQRDVRRAVSHLATSPGLFKRTEQDEYLVLAVSAALAGWPGVRETTEEPPPTIPPVQPSTVVSSPSPVTVEGTTRSPSRLALDDDVDNYARALAWSDSVLELAKKVSPLLRLAFDVLISCTVPNRGKVEEVVAKTLSSHIGHEGPLCLSDRLAIACAYINDDALHTFVDAETKVAIETGNLEGLVLMGMGASAKQLFQRCLDMSPEKFAHVALLSAMSDFGESANNPLLEAYRDWLDAAGLSMFRAKLDVGLNQLRMSSPTLQAQKKQPLATKETVHVHCAKCGVNLVSSLAEKQPKSGGGSDSRKYPNRMCANCARLLPVCSICRSPIAWPSPHQQQISMGTEVRNDGSELQQRRSEFRSWLSWCLECKHGGHVGCVHDWFALKRVCPVAGCACIKCCQGFS